MTRDEALALPTAEAATALGVHPNTVRRWRQAAGLTAPKRTAGVVVTLRLPGWLLLEVDAEALKRGCSRTELIKAALRREIGG